MMDNMNDKELNKALAEMLGWTNIHESGPFNTLVGCPPDCTKAVGYPPKFAEDLNVITDQVFTLTDDEYEVYHTNLVRICGYNPYDGWDFRPITEASARQRSEALLQTYKDLKE